MNKILPKQVVWIQYNLSFDINIFLNCKQNIAKAICTHVWIQGNLFLDIHVNILFVFVCARLHPSTIIYYSIYFDNPVVKQPTTYKKSNMTKC